MRDGTRCSYFVPPRFVKRESAADEEFSSTNPQIVKPPARPLASVNAGLLSAEVAPGQTTVTVKVRRESPRLPL